MDGENETVNFGNEKTESIEHTADDVKLKRKLVQSKIPSFLENGVKGINRSIEDSGKNEIHNHVETGLKNIKLNTESNCNIDVGANDQINLENAEQGTQPSQDGEEQDPDLPNNWKRRKHLRKTGIKAGEYYRTIVTNFGKVLRSQVEVDKYIAENKLPYQVKMSEYVPAKGTDREEVSKIFLDTVSEVQNLNENFEKPLEENKKRKRSCDLEKIENKNFPESKMQENELFSENNIVKLDDELIPSCLEMSNITSQIDENVNVIEEKEKTEDAFQKTESDLPPGWSRLEVNRKGQEGRVDFYLITEKGETLRSQREVNSYLELHEIKIRVKLRIHGDRNLKETDNTKNKLSGKSKCEEPVAKKQKGRPKKVTAANVGKENKPIKSTDENSKGNENDSRKENNCIVDSKTQSKMEETDIEQDLKLTNDELQYIEEIKTFLGETSLDLEPCPPTKGDGNCWFRAAADQVLLHNIPNQPTDHAAMRLAVCNHVKNLPEQVKQDTINVVYLGKARGLADLASRQRKLGQWVDNTGVMVMATAHLLARNIKLYGYGPGGGEGPGKQFSITTIEGGESADTHPPLTIFYYDKHYQTLRPVVNKNLDPPIKDTNSEEI